MEIIQESHPDFTAWDIRSKYYDPKSTAANPRWFMVSVRCKEKLKRIIPLSALKHYSELKKMILLKPGNRLSITPLTSQEWKFILTLQKEFSDDAR